MYRSTCLAFFGESITDYFAKNDGNWRRHVDAMPEDNLLEVSEVELSDKLAHQFAPDALHIDFDNPGKSRSEKQIPAEMFPPTYFVHRGKSYPKQVITIRLAFKGDPKLLSYRPSTFSFHSEEVYVEGNEICFDIIDFANDPEPIKRERDQKIATIRVLASNLVQDVERYNSGLRDNIAQYIRSRRAKIEKHRAIFDNL